jgi:hypothetical protein
MANNEPTLLQDVIEAVAGAMSIPTTPLFALGSKGYNVAMEEQADKDMPVIFYELNQSGEYAMTETGKMYLSYSTTLLFVDFSNLTAEESKVVIRQMHGTAMEFTQRIIRQSAFVDMPENHTIKPAFREVSFLFDTSVSGVELSFSLLIDPNVVTPDCS